MDSVLDTVNGKGREDEHVFSLLFQKTEYEQKESQLM